MVAVGRPGQLEALVVEDDPVTMIAISETVSEEGFSVTPAKTLQEAKEKLADSVPDILLLDVVLPDGNGLDLLKDLKERSSTEVILLTAHGKAEDSLTALQLGASNYLTKPVSSDQLKLIVSNVARNQELRSEIEGLRTKLRELGHFGSLLGTSPAMQDVFDQIVRVAPTDATVFVVGESGTGKELAAQNIHEFSRRRSAPFLPVNCGAIAPNLIESELFGHEKGSFTGAAQQHKGLFERANGGTLFLDEITEMPTELQAKLLRVLETGSVTRVGGDRPVEVDVRLIAATNRVPEKAVAEGELREDLHYRLSVFPILLPPLRERVGDVEFLAANFLADLNKAHGTSKKFSDATLRSFEEYDWPGNVRELNNVIHRAFILAEDVIERDQKQLQSSIASLPRSDGGTVSSSELRIRVGTPLKDVERRLIELTLEAQGGNKKKTAEVLGISLRTLYNRLKSYDGQG